MWLRWSAIRIWEWGLLIFPLSAGLSTDPPRWLEHPPSSVQQSVIRYPLPSSHLPRRTVPVPCSVPPARWSAWVLITGWDRWLHLLFVMLVAACKQTVAVSLRLTGVSNCDRSQCYDRLTVNNPISDVHSKFALRPHHVCKYGRYPVCDHWD